MPHTLAVVHPHNASYDEREKIVSLCQIAAIVAEYAMPEETPAKHKIGGEVHHLSQRE